MPEHLIALAVGPVQGFIAAARRTRDLWFGSYLLSEIAKAMALCLREHGADLIFPAPKSDLEPESPLDGPRASSKSTSKLPKSDLEPESALDVGNKILARARHGDPAKLAEYAKTAGQERWRELAEEALAALRTPGWDSIPANTLRGDLWEQQIGDVLELFAAWVEIGEDGYGPARRRVDRLLAARKSTRDFKPAAPGFGVGNLGFGLPKSSLDGARETVLGKAVFKDKRLQRRLGLGKNEQLDCPALVKRMGAMALQREQGGEGDGRGMRRRREQFAPVSRIALEAWLEGGKKPVPADELKEFKRQYAALVEDGLVTRVEPERYAKLPYDGSLLFPARLGALSRDLDEAEKARYNGVLAAMKILRAKLAETYGEPTPYFAVLQADGDFMGQFISEHDEEPVHIALTKALTGFAEQARRLIENDVHRGACVYAGGDDVLALLPLHAAVACARALRDAFTALVREVLEREFGSLGDTPPTLSVGLGLGHVMTPFACLLDLARRAERLAKQGPDGTPKAQRRNALAIIVGVRSGTEIEARGRWDGGMDKRLEQWTELYRADKLPDKAAFDLLAAVRQMQWTENLDRQKRQEILKQEVERVLKKKRAVGGTQEVDKKTVLEPILGAIDQAGVDEVLLELRVARWLAQKTEDLR